MGRGERDGERFVVTLRVTDDMMTKRAANQKHQNV